MRSFNPNFLNAVANDPDVRPWLGGEGEGEIDLSPIYADCNNYCFQDDVNGGVVFVRRYDGAYEAHTVASPGCARSFVPSVRSFVDYMFTHTDAEVLLTKVPENNKGARWLASLMGFQDMYHRTGTVVPGVRTIHMKLDLDRWAGTCSTLEEQGRQFHAALEAAKEASGSILPTHEEDPSHDRAVGAAILMAKAGNVLKAVSVYNRWAVFAGFVPIITLSTQPVVVDVHDAILGFDAGEMKVIQCR